MISCYGEATRKLTAAAAAVVAVVVVAVTVAVAVAVAVAAEAAAAAAAAAGSGDGANEISTSEERRSELAPVLLSAQRSALSSDIRHTTCGTLLCS
jgi:hypothetical protein